MKNYIVPIVCILAKLVWDGWLETCNINFVIAELEDKLQDDGTEESQVIQHVHRLLLKMWTTTWPKWTNDAIRIMDPTEDGLALLTLNQNGSFKEPKDMNSSQQRSVSKMRALCSSTKISSLSTSTRSSLQRTCLQLWQNIVSPTFSSLWQSTHGVTFKQHGSASSSVPQRIS